MDFDSLSERRLQHQARLLRSFCVQNPKDREEEVAAQDNKTSITLDDLNLDMPYKKLAQIIFQWYSKYIGPPVIAELQTMLEEDKDLELLDCLKSVREQHFAYPTVFTHVLDTFRQDTTTQKLNLTIRASSNILSDDGFQMFERGKPKTLKGPEQAIEYLSSELAVARTYLNPVFKDRSMEELRMFIEAQFQMKKLHGLEPRIYTGLSEIDDNTNGGKAGELWTIAGFVGHGKTTLAINWVYRSLADNSQSTAMFFSFEMPDEQLFNIFCARHNYELARLEGFKPLPYTVFRDKVAATDDEEDIYHYTLENFSRNFNDRLQVVKPRGPMSISDVRDRAEATHRQLGGLDMLVVDYLGLLAPDPNAKVRSKFDIVNYNFIAAKRMAMEFARGDGIYVLTPHQINRKGEKSAREGGAAREAANSTTLVQLRGRYEMDALADANEAERSSDVVCTIYQDNAYYAENRAVMCLLKNRDGSKPEPWMIEFYNGYRFIQQINADRENDYQQEFLTS